MLSRRKFAISLGALALAAPFGSLSQSAKIPRIGYLQPIAPQNGTSPFLEDFRRGLRDLGYVEGKNIQIEVRWGEGKLDRMPELAAELVRMNVDVIFAVSSPSVWAAKNATKTIPIVMPTSSDPVGDGLVASLARPGGNITGMSLMAPELSAKRLQLLKEVFPKQVRPAAVLWNPDYYGMAARFKEIQTQAPTVDMNVRSVEIRDSRELERALEDLDRERPDALVLLVDPLTMSQRFAHSPIRRGEKTPGDLRGRAVRRCGRSHVVRAEYRRAGPPCCHFRRQDPEGRKAWRSSHRAAGQVRPGDQSQDGQGPRRRDPSVSHRAGGSRHPIAALAPPELGRGSQAK